MHVFSRNLLTMGIAILKIVFVSEITKQVFVVNTIFFKKKEMSTEKKKKTCTGVFITLTLFIIAKK